MGVKDDPHSIVSINGDIYDSWKDKQLFQQVTVELTTNQASECLIRFFDPDFKYIDRYSEDDGVPHCPVDIWMGFGLDLGPKLYTGLMVRTERRDSDSTFRAYDKGHKMKYDKKNEYHNNMNDLDIIKLMATRNGLEFEGPDGGLALPPHDAMMQDHRNDWDLATERARSCGLVLYVRGNTLFAKEPAKVGTPLLSLIYRNDLLNEPRMFHHWDASFKLPENHKGRHKVVKHRYRERGGHQGEGESRRHKRGTTRTENKSEAQIQTKAYASRRAIASKELNREHAYVVSARSVPPLPQIRPDNRDTIALLNCGKLFSGSYLIDKIMHDHQGNGFVTEYTLYRDSNAG